MREKKWFLTKKVLQVKLLVKCHVWPTWILARECCCLSKWPTWILAKSVVVCQNGQHEFLQRVLLFVKMANMNSCNRVVLLFVKMANMNSCNRVLLLFVKMANMNSCKECCCLSKWPTWILARECCCLSKWPTWILAKSVVVVVCQNLQLLLFCWSRGK